MQLEHHVTAAPGGTWRSRPALPLPGVQRKLLAPALDLLVRVKVYMEDEVLKSLVQDTFRAFPRLQVGWLGWDGVGWGGVGWGGRAAGWSDQCRSKQGGSQTTAALRLAAPRASFLLRHHPEPTGGRVRPSSGDAAGAGGSGQAVH